MPVHDWTRVDAGIFHDFHATWLPELKKALNGGLLPEMPSYLRPDRYIYVPLERPTWPLIKACRRSGATSWKDGSPQGL